MRRPNAEHNVQPWRVHELARDFELLDVWRFPIRIDHEVPFPVFLECLAQTQSELLGGHGAAAMLFRLRLFLGRVFGWDRERSSASRANESGDRSGKGSDGGGVGFDPVYSSELESLAEIENATVHALIHLGRVAAEGGVDRGDADWAPQMAVYVKPRGLLGRAYMAAIGPFRHLVVYPAMLRAVARAWPDFLRAWAEANVRGEASGETDRFARAIAAIDVVNAQDPNTVVFAGEPRPKELLHAERATRWLETLEPRAGEALRLAVRAHHLRRWALPRSEYPMGRPGYHAWRRELQERHAREAGELMTAVGYEAESVRRVGELIRKRGLGRDPEAQCFEDVLCLVFVEMQLESFAAAHEAEKVVEILARTLPKMSERAIALAAELPGSPETKALLAEAVERVATRAERSDAKSSG